ncbi:MAG: CARDB domain-containing protein [Chitinophagales bacterium]
MFGFKKVSIVLTLVFILQMIICLPVLAVNTMHEAKESNSSAIIIDHNSTKLTQIPAEWIVEAKENLHIAYGHTSHGSQIISGMEGLVDFKDETYAFNNGGTDGKLDLRDSVFSGAYDLGNPDRTAWVQATKDYLKDHSDVNVVMWSWCGQVGWATAQDIDLYLSQMNNLESQYPNVRFVYMTGHLDGTGVSGNLNQRNEQIRTYCRTNNKILYDFADIESYDPDGVGYLDKNADDGCNYDSDANGSLDKNWAIDWQNGHTLGVDWYQCDSAHSQPLNANMKAYAAWWLFARLGGWQNSDPVVDGLNFSVQVRSPVSSLKTGSKALLESVVINSGNGVTPNTQGSFYLNDILLKTISIGRLKSGKQKVIRTRLDIPISAPQGSTSLKFQVEGIPGESNIEDNQAVTEVDVIRPDLTITSITPKGKILLGKTVAVDIQVSNLTTAVAKKITLILMAPSPDGSTNILLGTKKISSIGEGTKKVTMRIKITDQYEPGKFYLGAKIDPDNTIPEANEDNNELAWYPE